jgi:hypothetical protein
MVFNGLNNLKQATSHCNVSAKKRKTLNSNKTSFGGGAINYVGIFFF